MPASVHKSLIHGSIIIEHAIEPIGQLSEDAQEANHKCFQNYRENHSRKMSRKSNNKDIFKNLLIASDPIISLSRQIVNKCAEKRIEESDEIILEIEDAKIQRK